MSTMSERQMVLDEKEFRRLVSFSDGSAFNVRDSHQSDVKRDLQERFQRSQLATEDWHDTKENLRKGRVAALEARRDAEEETKLALDVQEAEYQAKQRAEAIAKAKEHLHSQTERVRKLKSALNFSQCLLERDKQIAEKRSKANEGDEDEERYFQQIVREDAQYHQELQMKEQKRREKNRLIERELKKQMELKKKKREMEREELTKMAEKLRLEEEEFVEKLRKRQEEEAMKKMGLRRSSRQTLEETDQINQRRRQLEKIEEERILKYEELKNAELLNTLSILEEEKRKREEVIARVSSMYGDLLEEKERKRRELSANMMTSKDCKGDERKHQNREKAKTEFLEHFRLKVDEKTKEQRENERRKKEERQKIDRALEAFEAECREKTLERARKNKSNQEHILKQIEEKRQLEEIEKRETLEYEKRLLDSVSTEEKEFEIYAKKAMEDALAKGQNIVPILKVVTLEKPFGRPQSAAWKT